MSDLLCFYQCVSDRHARLTVSDLPRSYHCVSDRYVSQCVISPCSCRCVWLQCRRLHGRLHAGAGHGESWWQRLLASHCQVLLHVSDRHHLLPLRRPGLHHEAGFVGLRRVPGQSELCVPVGIRSRSVWSLSGRCHTIGQSELCVDVAIRLVSLNSVWMLPYDWSVWTLCARCHTIGQSELSL